MYNRDYYAHVDATMMNMWKDFGRTLLQVLDGTVRYVLICPLRLYEYIYACIQEELDRRRNKEIRFRNVKRNGQI